MEEIVGSIFLCVLAALVLCGVCWEIQHMKAAIAKEDKQIELYERLLEELEGQA